jgi:trk system potassium uptake protein TrkH
MENKSFYNLPIRFFALSGVGLLFTTLLFYSDESLKVFPLADYTFLGLCALSLLTEYLKAPNFSRFAKDNIVLFFIALAYTWIFVLSLGGVFVLPIFQSAAYAEELFKIEFSIKIILFISFISFYWKDVKGMVNYLRLKPAQSFSLGFIVVIITGAFLLMLPVSRAGAQKLSAVDALFTSTSAVCVTGLIVVDTATFFSKFGQSVILLLIQIGGLGIMTLSAFIIIFAGSKMSLKEKTQTLAMLDQDSVGVLRRLIKLIILSTLIIELVAAVFIFVFVAGKFNLSLSDKIFFSIFHSISAFCNAGFSVMTDSLMGFSGNIALNIIIMSLIFFGGIGFPVLFNLQNWFFYKSSKKFNKKKSVRIQVQSKIALTVSIILVLLGALVFFILEYANILKDLSPGKKITLSFFQSVTTRTAGFNTVDIGGLLPSTLLFFIALMFIGASPSSTGGGVKTTTFFVLVLSLFATAKSKSRITFLGRTIPDNTIRKAAGLVFISIFAVIVSAVIINSYDKIDMLKAIFETTSAFATVGLSTGITSKLSTLSKSIIIFLMFFGRIGPINLLQAIFKQEDKQKIVYPDEKIMIG